MRLRNRAFALATISFSIACSRRRAGVHAEPALEATAESAVVEVSRALQPSAAAAKVPSYATLVGTTSLTAPHGRAVHVVPGARVDRSSPPRLITVLHALCTPAKENCEFLRTIADGRGFLVCPTGNASCSSGDPTWTGTPDALSTNVAASVDAAEAALDMTTDPARGDVLFGSSRGAYVARDLINAARDHRWRALVLVGGKIRFDPEVIRRAGIRRVLLAAPDFDEAAPTMRTTQQTLCAAGIPARFVSLGPHGHGMIDDSPGILAANMDWVIDESESDECHKAH